MKDVAESALIVAGFGRRARRRHRADASILAYHNILPDGVEPVGDRSLHLPRAAFAKQLDRLAHTHEIVPLRTLLYAEDEGRSWTRPRAAITFDDAYRGAMTVGLRELELRTLPAAVFVAPGLLGDDHTWWDRLADRDLGAVPSPLRMRALTEARGLRREVLAQFASPDDGARSWPSSQGIVTEEELLRAVDRCDLEVGSHTWSHANLASLEPDELVSEYERAHRWLASRVDAYLPWVAYPYGLSSARAEREASASHTGALRLGGGYATIPIGSDDPFRVPRMNIPSGVSLRGFELRTSGVIRR